MSTTSYKIPLKNKIEEEEFLYLIFEESVTDEEF